MAASTVYDFNRGWLFGGEYVANSEQPGFDDSRFGEVTLPHTVTNLSWGDWHPASWQKKWIYRKRFDSSALPQGRVFVDFDGVMTSARYFLDGRDVGLHQGGYLPFSFELTSHVPRGPACARTQGRTRSGRTFLRKVTREAPGRLTFWSRAGSTGT